MEVASDASAMGKSAPPIFYNSDGSSSQTAELKKRVDESMQVCTGLQAALENKKNEEEASKLAVAQWLEKLEQNLRNESEKRFAELERVCREQGEKLLKQEAEHQQELKDLEENLVKQAGENRKEIQAMKTSLDDVKQSMSARDGDCAAQKIVLGCLETGVQKLTDDLGKQKKLTDTKHESANRYTDRVVKEETAKLSASTEKSCAKLSSGVENLSSRVQNLSETSKTVGGEVQNVSQALKNVNEACKKNQASIEDMGSRFNKLLDYVKSKLNTVATFMLKYNAYAEQAAMSTVKLDDLQIR